MEDEVASRICNLVLNIMYTSLRIYCITVEECMLKQLTSIVGIKCVAIASNFPGKKIFDVEDH